ncbi:MAG TPA: hypothetical protein VFZ27_05605 [Terriglobia bacterium]|nr:hypothetical protein [Terriglobia bacterium]
MKINEARVVQFILAFCALAARLPTGLAQSSAQPNSKLSMLPEPGSLVENRLFVKMYDYARLSHPTRLEVEQVTSGIFARAGIKLIWIDRTVGEKLQQGPECNVPLGSAMLEVRILPRIRIVKNMPSTAASGYTTGNMATVSLERARMASAGYLASVPELLGCTIAHELGHILLGPNSHSVSGMMRPYWDITELQEAAQHFLLFDAKEAAQLRAEIVARAGPPTAGAMARATPPGKPGEKPLAGRNSVPPAEIPQDRR